MQNTMSMGAQPERQDDLVCFFRYAQSKCGRNVMPIILWLLGVPLSVVVVLWMLHVI